MIKNLNPYASEYGLQKGNVFLTFEQLGLMREVMEDCPAIAPFLNHLRQHTFCTQMLKWLKANKLSGRKLFLWIKDENEGSFLLTCAKIIKGIEKNKRLRPLYFGKDFRA